MNNSTRRSSSLEGDSTSAGRDIHIFYGNSLLTCSYETAIVLYSEPVESSQHPTSLRAICLLLTFIPNLIHLC
jgi:hypothetical protein